MLAPRPPRPIDEARLRRDRPFAERIDLTRVEPVPGFAPRSPPASCGIAAGGATSCEPARRRPRHEIQTLLGLGRGAFARARPGAPLPVLEALDEHRALDREALLARWSRSARCSRACTAAPARAGLPDAAGRLRAAARARPPARSRLRLLNGELDADTRRALTDKLRGYRRRFGTAAAVEMDDLPRPTSSARPRRRPPLRRRGGRRGAPRFTGWPRSEDRRPRGALAGLRRGYARAGDASSIPPSTTEYVGLLDNAAEGRQQGRSAIALDPGRSRSCRRARQTAPHRAARDAEPRLRILPRGGKLPRSREVRMRAP